MEIFLVFMLGASFGSFLGLVVDRFPQKSIISPQSHCESCGQTLQARDLIPILSQLINKSRCRFCKVKLPIWYALFEFACGMLLLGWWQGIIETPQLILLLLGAMLSLYDLKSQSYPILLWLLATLMMLPMTGVILEFVILFLLGIIAELIDVNIGSGDFYFLATLALSLTMQQLLWVIQIGSVLGIIACFLWKNNKIPFVPFLTIAYGIVLVIF